MGKQILITGAFGQLGESTLLELQPYFEIIASGKKSLKSQIILVNMSN